MSKITNAGVTCSGTGCFRLQLYPYGNSGRQMAKPHHAKPAATHIIRQSYTTALSEGRNIVRSLPQSVW